MYVCIYQEHDDVCKKENSNKGNGVTCHFKVIGIFFIYNNFLRRAFSSAAAPSVPRDPRLLLLLLTEEITLPSPSHTHIHTILCLQLVLLCILSVSRYSSGVLR